jgi:hypothetical protein
MAQLCVLHVFTSLELSQGDPPKSGIVIMCRLRA